MTDWGPIFIGGLDSSGKTLLRLMLSSHPNISMSRRTYMWTRFYNRYGDLSQPQNFERCFEAMLNQKPVQILRPDSQRIRREFWEGEPTYPNLFAIFHRHFAERMGKPRWGDQLGFIERYADPIFEAHPNARMIHMVRDPRDRYDLSLIPARRKRGRAGWNTARWLDSIQLAKNNQKRYPDRYMIVHYESLITNRQETLMKICAFIGEEFMPGMLTMRNAIRFGDDEPGIVEGYSRVPVAIPDKFRGPLPAKREVAFTQMYARHAMLSLGYPLEPVRLSLRDWLMFLVVDWPANLAGVIAWRTTEGKQPANAIPASNGNQPGKLPVTRYSGQARD
ncbi:MAG: sulfotransferase [Chloroflexota bacterium]|nr:MAG: sulfotransferase [Chloroflexota bacterium]